MIEFKGLVDEFKRVQLKSAKKAFSNSSGRHAHRVSSIIQHQARRRLLDALIPSSGTLLVIPRVLMDHWQVSIVENRLNHSKLRTVSTYFTIVTDIVSY